MPLVRLHLSGADIAHFERLHSHLHGPPRSPQRYRQENTWRRAQLGYDGRRYDIRVRSHGRNPDEHSERLAGWRYRFISLTISLEAGERILGLNRFKLIVRRAFPNAAAITGMAKHVGAFVQDHRLVRVRINNWPEHLVFFSNVLDNRYLESSGFGHFRRISYDYPETGTPDVPDDRKSDQSLIYTDGVPLEWEPEAFRRRFELALAQMEIPESEWEPLFERYAAFNAALSGSAVTDTDPTEFMDPGYMQRYETARYVMGLNGHGSLFGNLRVKLNTANGKFYPAFNRDNEMSELDLSGGRIPELQIDNLRPGFTIPHALPLFHYAAASAPLRQRVYREIYRFIERIAAGDGRPAGGAGRPEAGCRRPFAGGLPFVGEARPVGAAPCGAASPPSPDLVAGIVVSSNIESLKTYLEASAPEFSARVTARTADCDHSPELDVRASHPGTDDRQRSWTGSRPGGRDRGAWPTGELDGRGARGSRARRRDGRPRRRACRRAFLHWCGSQGRGGAGAAQYPLDRRGWRTRSASGWNSASACWKASSNRHGLGTTRSGIRRPRGSPTSSGMTPSRTRTGSTVATSRWRITSETRGAGRHAPRICTSWSSRSRDRCPALRSSPSH